MLAPDVSPAPRSPPAAVPVEGAAAGGAAMGAVAMAPERWEFGSILPLPPLPPPDVAAAEALPAPWADAPLHASGRDALRALLAHGHRLHGWRRAWLPDYFCQEVVAALAGGPVALRVYADAPTRAFTPPAEARAGDVLLYVNYLGVRPRGPGAELPCDVIEDHTHDPWGTAAHASGAAYALASLRKCLPVPVGSAVWSPRAWPLPPVPPVTPERERAAALKLAAMTLKTHYLAGHPVSKDGFRALAEAGEAEVASGPASGPPAWVPGLVASCPLRAWREQRRQNAATLRRLLAHAPAPLRLLPPGSPGTVEFCVPLLCEDAPARDALRARLAAARVYLPVLWPLEHPALEGVSADAVRLAGRMLCLPCDWRYGPEDLERVARALVQAAGRAA